MKHLLLILQLGLIAITCNVNAIIINNDTADFAAYKDTDTGLIWLDFGQNNTQTYNDVASQLGAGGEWEGWRLPTSSEVYTMWANVADLDNVEADEEFRGNDGKFTARDYNGSNTVFGDDSVWDGVFAFIGFNYVTRYENTRTGASRETNIGVGYFAGQYGLARLKFYDVANRDEPYIGAPDQIEIDGQRTDRSNDRDYNPRGRHSTLLVRKAASPPTDLPAPSTIAILGLGLLGLVARRKLF